MRLSILDGYHFCEVMRLSTWDGKHIWIVCDIRESHGIVYIKLAPPLPLSQKEVQELETISNTRSCGELLLKVVKKEVLQQFAHTIVFVVNDRRSKRQCFSDIVLWYFFQKISNQAHFETYFRIWIPFYKFQNNSHTIFWSCLGPPPQLLVEDNFNFLQNTSFIK